MTVSKVKIVLFDVDGVLVDTKSSWQLVHSELGVEEEANKGTSMYIESIIDYVGWLLHDTSLWSNKTRLHINELRRIFDKVKINPEAPDVVRELHRRGLRVGLVSAGIDLLVSRVAREIGADIWVANKLSYTKEGYLKPGGVPLVPAEKKDLAVRRILGELGIEPQDAAFVGDSPWDIPAFLVVGLPIGYGDDVRIEPFIKYRIKRLRELTEILF